MEFRFINQNSDYYKEALKVREEVFFKNFENSLQLLNDSYEFGSSHLVCLKNNSVIGTGRLTFTNKTDAIISQMAILPDFQNKGIGKQILKN